MKNIHLLIAVIALAFMVSCTPSGFYQKTYAIKDAEWTHDQVLNFDIAIEDTAANYNNYILIRHDDSYATSNIWINVTVIGPKDSTVLYEDRVELLMTDTDGKPLGKNFGDIWEQRKILIPNPIFTDKGIYTIRIAQAMRSNPLQGILNVGMQLEKIQ